MPKSCCFLDFTTAQRSYSAGRQYSDNPSIDLSGNLSGDLSGDLSGGLFTTGCHRSPYLILTKTRRTSQPLPVPPNRQHEKPAVDPDLGLGKPGVQASPDHVADACSHAFDVLGQVHGFGDEWVVRDRGSGGGQVSL